MYLQQIQIKIEQILSQKYNTKIIVKTNLKDDLFEFYLPLFPYIKNLNMDINKIFEYFQKDLISISEIDKIFLEKGFCKIKLKSSVVIARVLTNVLKNKEKYAQQKSNNKTVIIDYSSPNIAKSFSIGHLRSTVIGHTLKKIYQKLGFNVIGINHLGDWGTQFGKMILAYQKWGNQEMIAKDPINELQKLYVFFHQKAEENPQLNEEAKQIFLKLEQKEPLITKLWKWFKKISLKEFRKIYHLLGIEFDYYIGESFFDQFIPDVLSELKEKKLMKLDNNAYIIPLEEPFFPVLVQKNNGSTLYFTREIACVLNRYKQFKFHKCLFVVGNEQKLHFQQLKKVIEKMGYNYDLIHVNFGLITFQNIKISSRKNNQFQLKNIIQKTVDEAQKVIKEKNPNLENINQISTQIAIGAIVFNDLKNDRHLDIDFNLKQMLQFEGNTGPYLQYTIVRLYSLIRKNNSVKICLPQYWEPFLFYYQQPHYFNLIKLIDSFDMILKKSQEHHMPSILARYIFQLAKSTNKFYTKEKILVNNSILKKANLLLIETILIVLEEGLKILGIPILKKM